MINTADSASLRHSGLAPPFPGLRPFSTRDHKYFFGREDQTFALYLLLRNNHFVAVIGSSGSGKSSIVKAGLLPLLDEENEQAGKKAWRYATMRPDRDPMHRLANALAKDPLREDDSFFEARRDRIAAMLGASSQGISEALAHTSPETTTQLVLVVDQFEELFRLSAGPQLLDRIEAARRREEAASFVQLLLAATRSYDSRIRVVITMRSDFIGDCARFQGLPEVVSAAQFLVPSLSRDQREEAIRKPIELSGAKIDSELVERLLNDSSEELDQLPVLQHCLARLWMRAGSAGISVQPAPAAQNATAEPEAVPVRHLTEQVYRDIGGITGALSAHADDILRSLAGRENAAEQTFRALAEIDKDGRAVRRARPLSQLIAETGASREDICAVLDEFRADDCSFVVPPLSRAPTSELPDETVVDVGHEALLRRWVRVSGDPDATGQRADKRDIGWSRQEQKDGERYQFLRSCVDPDSLNESRLSDDQVRRYWNWWDNWKPNPAWAARYGGKFDDVKRLVNESYAASRRSKAAKVVASAAALIFVAGISVAFFTSWKTQRFAERVFDLTLTSVDALSDEVLESFNSGQTSRRAASNLTKITAAFIKEAIQLNETPEVVAAGTKWLLTASDISLAAGDKESARSSAVEAMSNAREYIVKEPGNRRWQELLYGSLFRIGDLNLDQSVHEDNPKLAELAREEYEESRRIADKLLAQEIAQLSRLGQKFETVSIDSLAKQRFDLAFAINKVGEAMQVQGNIKGALGKYDEALELATTIEGATRMEWKLQSATTRIKIAGAFMKQAPRDIAKALQNYSEAVEREEVIFSNNRTNNVVRSNLAAAYEGRAHLFEQDKEFDAAFKGYTDAASMFVRLVEEDPRDIKWLESLARAHRKFGVALESYAQSRNEPLDKAAEQYRREVAAREKLVEKAPTDPALQRYLRESQDRLQRVLATAAATGNPSTSQ